LETKDGREICLRQPVGCRLGRIDAGGGWSGLLGANLRRAAWWAVDVEPACVIFGIVKVEENVLAPDGIGFSGHGGEGRWRSGNKDG